MGLTKRDIYKPDRKAARKKGVLETNAPAAMLDASNAEVAMAIYAICEEAGVIIGRAEGYNALRDEYTVVGKSKETGRAQDWKVKGFEVALLIGFLRQLNGGKFDRQQITKKLSQRPVG
jgi:hypothetical protein